jgi:hypothetical protein
VRAEPSDQRSIPVTRMVRDDLHLLVDGLSEESLSRAQAALRAMQTEVESSTGGGKRKERLRQFESDKPVPGRGSRPIRL